MGYSLLTNVFCGIIILHLQIKAAEQKGSEIEVKICLTKSEPWKNNCWIIE